MSIAEILSPKPRTLAISDDVWSITARDALSGVLTYPFWHNWRKLAEQLGLFDRNQPTLDQLNASLAEHDSAWRFYGVPAYGPDAEVFPWFTRGRFPYITRIRSLREARAGRAEGPDGVHDMLGHAPMLAHPLFGAIVRAFGWRCHAAFDTPAFECLVRLFVNTIEFGLYRRDRQVYGFGAALASAPQELHNVFKNTAVHWIRLDTNVDADVIGAMRRRIHFSELQDSYTVVTDWRALLTLLCDSTRIARLCARAAALPELSPGAFGEDGSYVVL